MVWDTVGSWEAAEMGEVEDGDVDEGRGQDMEEVGGKVGWPRPRL